MASHVIAKPRFELHTNIRLEKVFKETLIETSNETTVSLHDTT